MFRKDLIDILLNRPCTVEELAELMQAKHKDVVDDLRHLLRSLKHQPYAAVIVPPHCKQCGFDRFKPDKLNKPSRCPRCKGSFVAPPRIYLERTG